MHALGEIAELHITTLVHYNFTVHCCIAEPVIVSALGPATITTTTAPKQPSSGSSFSASPEAAFCL